MTSVTLAFSLVLTAASPVKPAGADAIAVTIDDLPLTISRAIPDDNQRKLITQQMLSHLSAHGIRAVGLVTASRMRSPKDRVVLDAWLKAGHELGNHTFDHLDFTKTPLDRYVADVERARAFLQEYLSARGRTVRFFRFPFLREGNTREKLDGMRAYLAKSGQVSLPVTIETQDWSFEERYLNAQKSGDHKALAILEAEYIEMMRQALRHHTKRGEKVGGVGAPNIILLHAGVVGAALWGKLFEMIKSENFTFATVPEVVAHEAFQQPPDYVGDFGYGLWDRKMVVSQDAGATQAISMMLDQQARAWNRGKIGAFCSVYAEDATFISPSGITRGRAAIQARYEKKYNTPQKRGLLSFEIVETRIVRGTEFSRFGDAVPGRIHGASTILKWNIDKSGGSSSGLSMIMLHRDQSGWSIVQDASM